MLPPTVKQLGKSQPLLVLLWVGLLPFLLLGSQSSPQMAHPSPGSHLGPYSPDSLMAVLGLFFVTIHLTELVGHL